MGDIRDFDRLHRIGKGAMGEVWEAVHRTSRTRVAIKTSSLDNDASEATTASTSDAEAKTQLSDPYALTHEIRAMAGLDHECIAPIFDHGVEGGRTWFASGFAAGGDLTRHPPTSWHQAQDLLEQILRALAHAHSRGVIHRDLKPANVLLNGTGGVWLTDFGIAWCGRGAEVAGTPRYMAPEQIGGEWRRYGPWTDLYALGCLAWWMVTGHPPFANRRGPAVLFAQMKSPPPPLRPSFAVPKGLTAWLLRLLAKPTAQRFQTAPDALEALRRLTGDAPHDPLPDAYDPRRVPHPPLPTTHRFAAAGLALLDVRPIPLVGRDKEFDTLTHRLRRAQQGTFQAVATAGSGLGSTHLLETFARQASERGAAVSLRLDASDREALLASFVVGEGLSELQPEEREGCCRSWLSRHPDIERLTLDALLAGTLQLAEFAALLDSYEPERVTIVVVQGPMAEPLRQALAELDSGVLLLADRSPLDAETMQLGPLDAPAVVQLGWCMAGLDAETCRELHARLGGSPRAIVKLVRQWVSAGVLTSGAQGTKLAPDPFRSLDTDLGITRRLGPDAARQASLQLMSLLGPNLPAEHVDVTVLKGLIDRGLARSTADGAWLDPAVCHWVAARIPATALTVWSDAADRLEEPTRRLECLIRAGRTQEAVVAFIELSETGHGRIRRLGELWRLLHPLINDPSLAFELELAHLELLHAARAFRPLIAGFEVLDARMREPAARVQVKRGLADALRLSGKPERALPHLHEAIALCRRHRLPGLGRLMGHYGLALEATHPTETDLVLEEATELAIEEEDDKTLGTVRLAQGRRALGQQRYEEAVDFLQGSLTHRMTPANRVAGLGMLSSALAAIERVEEAEQACDQAVKLSEEEASQHLAGVLATQSKLCLRLGRTERAWRSALRAQQLAARHDRRRYLIYATLMLARVGVERGEVVSEELHRLRTYLGGDFADREVCDVLRETAARGTGLDKQSAHDLAEQLEHRLAKN